MDDVEGKSISFMNADSGKKIHLPPGRYSALAHCAGFVGKEVKFSAGPGDRVELPLTPER